MSGARECQNEAANVAANLNRSNLDLSIDGEFFYEIRVLTRDFEADPYIDQETMKVV